MPADPLLPKAAAKHELLFNKPTSGLKTSRVVLLLRVSLLMTKI